MVSQKKVNYSVEKLVGIIKSKNLIWYTTADLYAIFKKEVSEVEYEFQTFANYVAPKVKRLL